MPYKYNTSDEVKFLNNWFDTWSDLQKSDFLPILSQTMYPESHINGLVGNLPYISDDQKRPTIFDCQVKLFQEWFDHWEETERQQFLNHIKDTDEQFCSHLDMIKRGDSAEKDSNLHQLQTDEVLTVLPLSLHEVDDGIAGHSSSSSTHSSLTQSQSNNDSGLEANKSDSELTKDEK